MRPINESFSKLMRCSGATTRRNCLDKGSRGVSCGSAVIARFSDAGSWEQASANRGTARWSAWFGELGPAVACFAVLLIALGAGTSSPDTIVPVPRDEHWRARHAGIVEEARRGGFELAFLGDSITQGWAHNGRKAWDARYAPRHAINLGIGGDRTQHVLWRLDHGLLDALTQQADEEKKIKANTIKAVVLMIGTNNSNDNDNTAEDIAAGIKEIVARLRSKLPQAKILLLAIFPRGDQPNPQREKIARASELAAAVADGKMVHFLDIGEKFLNDDGSLPAAIMPDFLHLSERGYEIWADAMEKKLAELIGGEAVAGKAVGSGQ